MFDLEGGGRDLGIAEEIHDELAVKIANADGFGQTLAHKALHSRPGLLDGSFTGDNVLAIISEARWVSFRGVDIFEGDGKMDDVKVKVVDAPVLKLLFADGLHTVMVVERVPKFGDKEEVGAFHYALFDGASDAFAGFLFVAVVWKGLRCECWNVGEEKVRPTTSTVEEAVARLDGVVDGIGTGIIVDFPKPRKKISMLCEKIE